MLLKEGKLGLGLKVLPTYDKDEVLETLDLDPAPSCFVFEGSTAQ
jgi:hypothetical protein